MVCHRTLLGLVRLGFCRDLEVEQQQLAQLQAGQLICGGGGAGQDPAGLDVEASLQCHVTSLSLSFHVCIMGKITRQVSHWN